MHYTNMKEPNSCSVLRSKRWRLANIVFLILLIAGLGFMRNEGVHKLNDIIPWFPQKKYNALNLPQRSSSRKLNAYNSRQYRLLDIEKKASNKRMSMTCFRFDADEKTIAFFAYIANMEMDVFPECQNTLLPLNQSTLPLASEGSILFYPWGQKLKKDENTYRKFPGTRVYFLPESFHPEWRQWAHWRRGNSKEFALGPVKTSNATMYFPLLAQRIAGLDVERRKILFTPKERPRNNGKYFLAYTASHRVPFREEAFNKLASIGVVHYGGACKGSGQIGLRGHFQDCDRQETNRNPNVQAMPSAMIKGEARRIGLDNSQLYKDYRFALVMENAMLSRYMTEKILFAFLGGSIPIWYGTTDIFDIINKDAFVYYDARNPQPALQLIQHLEANRTAYDEMLSAPILANGEETIEKYFSTSDGFGSGILKKKIRQMVGFEDGSHLSDQL